MYKHQEQFLKITQEYNRQINQLLDLAKKSDRKQITHLTEILNKLQNSLQNLQKQQELFKKHINNPAKYKALLQPFIELLDETNIEIERLNREPKH